MREQYQMEKPYVFGMNFGKDVDAHNDDADLYLQLTYKEKLTFWRGYFDVHGNVRKDYAEGQFTCKVKIMDTFLINEFQTLFQIPSAFDSQNSVFHFQGINVLEFLHQLYEHTHPSSNINAKLYNDMLYGWQPTNIIGTPVCKFWKTLEDAVAPIKVHISDSGYDLQLIRYLKTENGVDFYDTGIAVQPPIGYYFDLVARSSLAKTGYVLANSVGIIDASYTGSIKVALIKACNHAPDLKLPARIVQLIPRKYIHLPMQETTVYEKTQRNDGGFGSTN